MVESPSHRLVGEVAHEHRIERAPIHTRCDWSGTSQCRGSSIRDALASDRQHNTQHRNVSHERVLASTTAE